MVIDKAMLLECLVLDEDILLECVVLEEAMLLEHVVNATGAHGAGRGHATGACDI